MGPASGQLLAAGTDAGVSPIALRIALKSFSVLPGLRSYWPVLSSRLDASRYRRKFSNAQV
ncbi:MAG: hypothetical protein WBM81_01740, partial [Sedimenticolaceae bacterium]